MKTYEMTLILSGVDPDNIHDLTDRCYHEFNDGLIGVSCGVPYIDVGREANSLEDAIKSALVSASVCCIEVKYIRLNPQDYQ